MSTPRLAVAAVALTLVGAGCGAGNGVSLQQVEAAFARNGLPFRCAFQVGGSNHPCTGGTFYLLKSTTAHLRGFALGFTGTTPVRSVVVFDSSAAAKTAAARDRTDTHHLYGDTIVVAQNVVYTGSPSAAADRAMASLRK